ncbi:cytochrome P450 [Actinosynnema sp. NPDC047251]|uniref:Cytochrome P450, 105C1 family n=1 Tax=Saccharothrix espanaensis (strain ATCC 51144 / DSM 44229 / JCM 9112 / NBRC 15066 / NRRL 15764) TaxID=1179773 RepID=K0K6T6_SACES|nr:cytochrome P450 [Saccharothrix espanaensis]CCH33242.1 Cytochrome P450, 105C1 family [Saccharothrix espanaensis DSM 44229]
MTSPTVSPDRRPSQDRLALRLPPEYTERAPDRPFHPAAHQSELGREGPVHEVALSDGDRAWLVTGHEEARALLADPRLSSDRFRSTRMVEKIPPELRKRLLDPATRAGNFITMDAPDHTRYRRLLTGQFTVRRMRLLEPRVHEIVTSHLDAMIEAGTSADLVPAFALPVPSLVICELLGVRYEDRDEFQERTSTLLRLDAHVDDVVRAADEQRAFMRALVRRKRVEPADDLLSGLIEAEAALTDDELVSISNLLLIAGHETTANMIGLGTFALLEHPAELARLRADPSLTPGAVEELLRYLSIVHLGPIRLTLEDVEIGGVTVPADSTVIVSVPVVNRDPRTYRDPDTLDVARPRVSHLAFGHGIHQCLGQQLARVEMAVAFTEMLRRLPGLRLDLPAGEVPLRSDMLVYGVHSLPVSWDETAS